MFPVRLRMMMLILLSPICMLALILILVLVLILVLIRMLMLMLMLILFHSHTTRVLASHSHSHCLSDADVDDVFACRQALETKESLHDQRRLISSSSSVMGTIATKFPVVHQVMDAIRHRKIRENVVLAAVTATCICAILWYIMRAAPA